MTHWTMLLAHGPWPPMGSPGIQLLGFSAKAAAEHLGGTVQGTVECWAVIGIHLVTEIRTENKS